MWLWTKDKEYSANSFYKIVISAGKTKWPYRFIWQLKIPPTVRVFAFLLLQGRLLTHDVMLHRGIHCESRCAVCQNCSMETSLHLFFRCSFSRRVWTRLNCLLGISIIHFGDSVQAIVDNSWSWCKNRCSRNKWGSYFFSICWYLWRGRNQKIFEDCVVDPDWMAHRARREAELWMKYCWC